MKNDLITRLASLTLSPAALPDLLAQCNATQDEVEALHIPGGELPATGFPDNYIIMKTALRTQQVVTTMLGSDALYDEEDEPIETLDEAMTPCRLAEDEVTTWTLDLGLDEARENAIRTLVADTIARNLPEGVLQQDFAGW